MTNLNVPHHSQMSDHIDKDLQENVCGIVCVKMIIDFYEEGGTKIQNLITEGKLMGGYVDGLWVHDALVRLLRNHGVHAYSQEFKSHDADLESESFSANDRMIEFGILKIKTEIALGNPVIVSMKAGFGDNKESHLVAIKGIDTDESGDDIFIINDPQMKEKELRIPIDYFMKFWRNFAIFSAKNNV